jgi:OmpA-OmpF porin, OOP family
VCSLLNQFSCGLRFDLAEGEKPRDSLLIKEENSVKDIANAARSLLTTVPLVLCALGANPLHAQQDKQGCKDSPFLSRYPSAVLEDCSASEDDSLNLVVEQGKTRKVIEGKVNHYLYNLPSFGGWAPITRNINTALRQAGWANDYMSGDQGTSTWHKNSTWIAIDMGGGRYHVDTVTLIKLTQDVVASAADLGNGIDQNGHAVVPGILFDTAKADVKDESKPALDEVAKLLNGDPKLRLWVVGHTDSVSSVASNVDLSKRRAAAVIAVLVSNYHIAPTRLDSFGAGPYAPVASNDSDTGRTQNRRVEIVKR